MEWLVVQCIASLWTSIRSCRHCHDDDSSDRQTHSTCPYRQVDGRYLPGELPARYLYDARGVDVRFCLAAILPHTRERLGCQATFCASSYVLRASHVRSISRSYLLS